MKNTELTKVLRKRHYLVSEVDSISSNTAYYNAYLLSNFGIVVDKPNSLSKQTIDEIVEEFHLTIPKSFYSNPQDTKLFTKDELLVEQLVSYFAYGSDLGRIEIFKKDFPEYVVGDELKLRTFYIVTEEEANDTLYDIANAYCAYTRPFSNDELAEFVTLFTHKFYDGQEIKCKDNIISMLSFDKSLARYLDKKDIVKMSIKKFGDKADFKNTKGLDKIVLKLELEDLASYIPYVKHCPMSKKQAKYFNKIVSMSGIYAGLKHDKESNIESPDKFALALLDDGDVIGAAKVYAASGSMLERRIKMLLSRANPKEAVEILDMLPASNPIILYQLMSNLSKDDSNARTFTYFYNNKVRTYRETEYESKYRKSHLNKNICKLLTDTCIEKIKDYYKALPTLGKVYIADNFYKLGMPTNTSASGKGIDVLPIGSRLPCTCNNIRTFVHWKDAFDIDSSLIIVDKDNNLNTMGWFNYGGRPCGYDISFSGDITGRDGAEFFDIDINALAKKGYKYVVQTFHGYCSKLDSGEIYAGYQNKSDLNTAAWDPKNIEMQFKVHGDSRGCIAFAIDIQNREVIILNQIIDDDGRVIKPEGFKTIEKYLQPEYLDVNIGMIAECRGKLQLNPADADVVFDDTYVQINPDALSIPKQTVIRSWELEKLVAFINN